MHVRALLNLDSGTLRTADIEDLAARIDEAFPERGHSVETLPVHAREFDKALEESMESPADVVLVAGGDGSVSAAAAACYRHGKILAVLPAGTMNLFARSLDIPLNLEDAIPALAGGDVGRCDIALVNGRPFIHQYSVGLHPNMAEERKNYSYNSRITKMLASLTAMLAQFSRPPAFNVTMTLSERRSNQVLSALAVFNNPLGPGHMPYADRLDSGVLGIYTAGVLSRAAYLKLSADLIAGSWSSNADLREARTERIVLEFSALRRRTSSALIDGELVALERHVEIRLEPQGLKVLRPNRDR